MRSTTTVVFALLVATLVAPRPVLAETWMHRVLAERAEAPPEVAATDRDLLGGVHPGALLFSMDAEDHARCVRAIPDVTGDGRDEVAAGIDVSGTDNVFVLDGASDGTTPGVVWSLATNGGLSGGSPYGDESLVPIPDSDDNGHANLLVGTAWGGRTAFDFDTLAGSENWRFNTYDEPESGWVYSLAQMSDLDGDGVPEVAFGAGSDNNTAYLVDGDGTPPDGVQASVRWRYFAPDAVVAVANLGDADGDGADDVLAAIGDFGYSFVLLDGNPGSTVGAHLWQYPTGTRSAVAVDVLPDVTGDGVDEALVVLWTIDGNAVRALNGATGQLVWASTAVPEYGMMAHPIGDVDHDGFSDVVVASWENAVIVLSGADGTLVWKTTVGTTNGGDVWTARGIGDLNADGYPDVVAGSFDTHVYAMSGKDGTIFWAYPAGRRIYSVAPVGDLDGDGTPEVVAGTQNLAGTSLPVVLVLDGDAGIGAIFADDFETGDTARWSL